MERIRQKTVGDYDLSATATDANGDVVDVTGTLAVTIYDSAGAPVFTGTPNGTGSVLPIAVPVEDLPLDTYRSVWTFDVGAATQELVVRFEIVGGFLFELPELRALDPELEDVDEFPEASLELARQRAEYRLEYAANVAFVRRGAFATLSGPSRRTSRSDALISQAWEQRHWLKLPHFEVADIYAVAQSGVALTGDELADIEIEDNRIYSPSPWESGRSNISVHYSHGRDVLDPLATYAALLLAKEYALRSTAIPERATMLSTDIGAFRITQADATGKTGLPEVDAIVGQIGRKHFAVG
jgi:hypothetical protein